MDVEPFKGLLLGLFFMTVGMSIDVVALFSDPLVHAAAVVALLVVKAAAAFGAARAMRIETAVSIEAALLLAGAGEFAFVVFAIAARSGVIALADAQFMIAVATLSMLAIPGLGRLGWRLAGRARARADTTRHGVEAETFDLPGGHVVIAGFGRVGRTVAQLLDADNIPYVALDLDSGLCAREREGGRPVYYGDASRGAILERLGGAGARAFVVTTDDPAASERTVREIRAAWPHAAVIARARDMAHARRLYALGATVAVPETLEGSLQLGAEVLAAVGLPEDAVDARVDYLRGEITRRLSAGRE